MAPRTPKPPNGLNRPSARSRPPPNSPTAATQVQNQAGLNRCLAIPAVVVSMPPPPNQPNSFCEPCAATVKPTPTRRIKRPIASAMRKSPRITNSLVRTRTRVQYAWYITNPCSYANRWRFMYYQYMTETITKALTDQRLLPLLEHLARVGRRAFENTLEPGDLRPRHLIALQLLSERGPASQQALADSLSLDPSNVVGLLNELEERKLVTRRRDSADRRRHIVELSPRGKKELCDAFDRLRRIDDDLLGPLSARERAVLYDLLVRAVGAKTPPCDIPEDSAVARPKAR